MRAIIAGCGRVGSYIASHLANEGFNVVVIDRNAESFERLDMPFNGVTIQGIAFDESVLLSAGVQKADCFVSVTNYDNTNIMSAEIASRIFEVPEVIARIYNPDKEATCEVMGIHHISGSVIIAEAFKKAIRAGNVSILSDAGDDCLILCFRVGSLDCECCVEELRKPGISRILSIFRKDKPMFFKSKTNISEGDEILMAISHKGLPYIHHLASDKEYIESISDTGEMSCDSLNEIDKGERKTIICGCGSVGSKLAAMLDQKGWSVRVIDNDPKAEKMLESSFEGFFICGNAFDEDVLISAGIEDANMLLAVTNYDNANLMASLVASRLYETPRVISRLYNPDKERTYQALDIEYICHTTIISEEIINMIERPSFKIIDRLGNNRVILVRFTCPSKWNGRRVDYVESEELMRLGILSNSGGSQIVEGSTVLKTGDEITAAALAPRIDRVRRIAG